MNSDALHSFSENLKKERIERNITLEDIEKSTRIRFDYLEAIEEGNFGAMPAGYERIFLKSYLTKGGFNVEEKLDEIDRLLFKKVDEKELSYKIPVSSIDLSKFKKMASWVPIGVVVIGLLYFVIDNFNAEEPVEVVQEMPIDVAKTMIDTVIAPVIEQDTIAVDSLHLTIRTSERVFFYIKIDSIYEVKKTGRKDREYKYTAIDEFNIYIADANSAEVLLNDSLVFSDKRINYRVNYLRLTKDGVVGRSVSEIEESKKIEIITPTIGSDTLIVD